MYFPAGKLFNISKDISRSWKISDNLGAVIPPELFVKCVKTFHKSASFYLHVEYANTGNEEIFAVTSEVTMK
jgi:hypothetical protein